MWGYHTPGYRLPPHGKSGRGDLCLEKRHSSNVCTLVREARPMPGTRHEVGIVCLLLKENIVHVEMRRVRDTASAWLEVWIAWLTAYGTAVEFGVLALGHIGKVHLHDLTSLERWHALLEPLPTIDLSLSVHRSEFPKP
jgi:hypothetical protein